MKLLVSSIFLVGAAIVSIISVGVNENFQIITLIFIVLSLINFIQYKSSK